MIVKTTILLILTLISFNSVADDYPDGLDITVSCDKEHNRKLRYGHEYILHDSFSSTDGKYYGLNSVKVNYTEQYDYNGNSTFPNFSWTKEFEGKNHIIAPSETIKAIIADEPYPIKYHPVKRAHNNLVVKYTVKYFSSSKPHKDIKKWVGPKFHTSCVNYEITRCGDGILDIENQEECEQGGLEKHCSNDCKISK